MITAVGFRTSRRTAARSSSPSPHTIAGSFHESPLCCFGLLPQGKRQQVRSARGRSHAKPWPSLAHPFAEIRRLELQPARDHARGQRCFGSEDQRVSWPVWPCLARRVFLIMFFDRTKAWPKKWSMFVRIRCELDWRGQRVNTDGFGKGRFPSFRPSRRLTGSKTRSHTQERMTFGM